MRNENGNENGNLNGNENGNEKWEMRNVIVQFRLKLDR